MGLLQQGSGGLKEVQEAVDRYQDHSPLFGFIQYRRRKVLLKYIPEGTSRLLQGMESKYTNQDQRFKRLRKLRTARVTVHFQSVTEKLSPHDTIFSFTQSAELQDSNLASACSLHTAPASTKSSNDSIPQRNLVGITEDASESRVEGSDGLRNGENGENHQRASLLHRDSGDSQTRLEKVNENADAKRAHEKSSSITTQRSLQRARTVSNVDKALPPIPGKKSFDTERELGERSVPRSVPGHGEHKARPSVEGRVSSQSARPSTRELYDAYGYKQKVKLGPRPSMESAGRWDNTDQAHNFRPVSTLPAGLRMPIRKGTPQKGVTMRPQSQQSQRSFVGVVSHREKPPATPITPIKIPERKVPIISNGLLTPAKTPAEVSSPHITPEKRRLMKALQLRQRQMTAQKPSTLSPAIVPAEPAYSKPDLDDAISGALGDASIQEADPDLGQIAVRDIDNDIPRNAEASPISIPEFSEGPSTQASSITDEGEDSLQDEKMPTKADNLPPIRFSATSADSTLRGSVECMPRDANSVLHIVHQPLDHGDIGNPGKIAVSGQPVAQPSAVIEKVSEESNVHQKEIPSIPLQASDRFISIPAVEARKELSSEIPTGHQEMPPRVSSPTNPIKLAATLLPTGKDYFSEDKVPEDVKLLGNGNISRSDAVFVPTTDVAMTELERDQPDMHKDQTSLTTPRSESNDPGTLDTLYPSDQQVDAENLREERPSSDHFENLIHPPEVPLLPVSEDEETSLNLNQASQHSSPILQSSSTDAQYELPRNPAQTRRLSQEFDSTTTEPSTADTVKEQQAERQMRRRGVVNPAQRPSSPEQSDEQLLSDDTFMEELKSATLQEAKPISVSKSPIKPVFSRTASEQKPVDKTSTARSVSSPLEHPKKDDGLASLPRLPTPLSPRSFSASHSPRTDGQDTPAPMPKKIGVSSGISQRIKALEQLSSRPTSPQTSTTPNLSTSANQRKSSFRSPRGNAEDETNYQPSNKSRFAYPSPSPSPETIKSNPFNHLNKLGFSRPESVSVTATIVRDTRNNTPQAPSNVSESRAMNLHQSPLVVEHQTMMPPPPSPLKPPRPPYARYASGRSGSTSSTEQKGEAPLNARRGSYASTFSKSSRAGSEAELPRTLSDSSLNTITDRDENREEKKDSKRSRLLKRMSSISSMSRRSIANALTPSTKEPPVIERQETIVEAPSAMVDVGDVNVQFPDNLVSPRKCSFGF